MKTYEVLFFCKNYALWLVEKAYLFTTRIPPKASSSIRIPIYPSFDFIVRYSTN